MTIGRSIPQYGRIEVGQHVEFSRLVAAPTPEPASIHAPQVTLRGEYVVTDIRHCDSGALVTLTRHSKCVRHCFNSYAQLWGGFGGLTVVRQAPRQMSMVREAA